MHDVDCLAAFIAYNLAVKAPMETLTAVALTLTCATLVKLIGLEIRANERTRLKRILKQIQTETGLGQQLKLVWIPNGSPRRAGRSLCTPQLCRTRMLV